MNNDEIRIDTKRIIAAYKNANICGKKTLEQLFGEDFLKSINIVDKIKTFEDAVSFLGNDDQTVIDYYAITDSTCTKDIIAFVKLLVITKALNERWKPNMELDEYYYYPCFVVYNKKDYNRLSDDYKKKKKFHIIGFENKYVMFCTSTTSSSLPTKGRYHFAFKTKELATYCGEQFIDIWAQYLLLDRNI